MIVMGIDIGFNHCGLAIFVNKEYFTSENYVVEKDDTEEIKYEKFYDFIISSIESHKPDLIVCERAFLGPNRRVFGLISELSGIIKGICFERDISFSSVATSTYRSKLGIPNKKLAAKELVKSLYPHVEIDDESDIPDAICLAKYGSELI
jgi:Holliday junction resolvasome RuvABC endonuclease subunit